MLASVTSEYNHADGGGQARAAAAGASEEADELRREAEALRAELAMARAERDAMSRMAGDWARSSLAD